MEKVINDASQHAKIARKYAECTAAIRDLAKPRGAMAERLATDAYIKSFDYVKQADMAAAKFSNATTKAQQDELTVQSHNWALATHRLLNRVIGHIVGNYDARKREEYVSEQDELWNDHETQPIKAEAIMA